MNVIDGVRKFLVILLAMVALAGCGSKDTLGTNAVDVRVRQVMQGAGYVEGAYSYIRVESTSGDKLLDERLPAATGHYPAFVSETVLRLDPGEYRFVSFQRPCDGNCGSLDPPTDECKQIIRVDESADLTVTVRPGEGCTFTKK
jgi:hypothetical protein